jgi:hypothetical protein
MNIANRHLAAKVLRSKTGPAYGLSPLFRLSTVTSDATVAQPKAA